MKTRAVTILLAIACLFACGAATAAPKYKYVRDASGQYYLIDANNSFWSKIKHPWLWLKMNRIETGPDGFGRAITQRQLNKGSLSTQAEFLANDAVNTVNDVPVTNLVTSPVTKFLGWGQRKTGNSQGASATVAGTPAAGN